MQDAHNPKYLQVLSVARAASTDQERKIVMDIVDHATRCRICARYVYKEGFNSVSQFRDYLRKEWGLPPFNPLEYLALNNTEQTRSQ